MKGTAANPAPTAPTTAVVAVRKRRRPWSTVPPSSTGSSTRSLAIRHSANLSFASHWLPRPPWQRPQRRQSVTEGSIVRQYFGRRKRGSEAARPPQIHARRLVAGHHRATVTLRPDPDPLPVPLGFLFRRQHVYLSNRHLSAVIAGPGAG